MKKSNKNNNNSVSKTSMLFHKSKGQHILIQPQLLQNIVQKSNIRPTDIVLEIGPGTGNLTQLLLQQAKKVIAIELDVRMVAELSKRFKYGEYSSKLELIQGDILSVELPYFDICVANIPYQISSPIVFKLLSHRPAFRHAILMFQKEFAMRLVAKRDNDVYCRLSVNVQLLSKVEHLMKVGKNNFKPPPKVESAIVKITPKSPPPPINYIEWDALLRICFLRKNKTLGAIFKHKKLLVILEKNYKLMQNVKKEEEKTNNSEDLLIKAFQNMSTENNSVLFGGQLNINEMEKEDNEADAPDQMQVEQQQPQTFKEKIMKILTDNQYNDKRAKKLEVSDFLILLNAFNENGIHFK